MMKSGRWWEHLPFCCLWEGKRAAPFIGFSFDKPLFATTRKLEVTFLLSPKTLLFFVFQPFF